MRGFPIRTSSDHSSFANSPRLIAGHNVLLRLLMPRHPPFALKHLTTKDQRCSRPLCSSQTTNPTHHHNHTPQGPAMTAKARNNNPQRSVLSQDPTVCPPPPTPLPVPHLGDDQPSSSRGMNMMFHPRVTGNPTTTTMMFDLPPTTHTRTAQPSPPTTRARGSTSEHEQDMQETVSSQR